MKPAVNKPPAAGAQKRPKPKNLSPAKKFRLRLRRAKFQKQQQAKDDYYEHDNRDMAKAAAKEKKRTKRQSQKGRQAQMYIDAYLKSQHVNQNGDAASQDDTQESSNGNEVPVKSIVHRASFGLPPMTSHVSHAFGGKEQATQNSKKLSTVANVAGNAVKCCCHCSCAAVKKKKPRRKLSSPYFGDFNRTLSSCAREGGASTTKILNATTTTTHHETLVKAGEFVALSMKQHRQLVPAFGRNYAVPGRSGSGVREMRSVVRFVKVFRSTRRNPLSGLGLRKTRSLWREDVRLGKSALLGCVLA
jgi:hypothetical protein